MKNRNKLSALAVLCIISLPAFGQKKDSKLENENVDIVRDYKPKILDAAKIEVLPAQEKLEVKKPDIKYSTPPELFVTAPYKTAFRTLQTTKTEQEPLQHAYFKAGLGNYNNIYAEGFYNTLYNKNGQLTAQAKYHSGIGPVTNSQFMDAFADVNGKKIFGKNIVTGDVNFNNRMLHFYGYDHDTIKSFDGNKIKQNFSDFNISGGFEHAMADTGQLKYKLGVAFNYFQDNFSSMENDLLITGRAIEPFHQNSIVFDAGFDYLDYKYNLLKTKKQDYSRNIVKVDVNYKFAIDGLRGYAGFKTADETDSGSSVFHVYPNVQIEGDLVDKALVGFAGITGGLQRNTFKSFSYENPYIESALDLRNTNNKLNVFGGFKGSASSNVFYLVSASYESYKNMHFFLNDSLDTKRFITVYDNNTTVFHVHAEGGIDVTSQLNLYGHTNFYSYSLSSPLLQKPFYKPSLDITVGGKYIIENKITIGADFYATDTRYARIANSTDIISLKPVLDMNLYGTYRHSDVLSFYLEILNVFNQQYQMWNYYPVRGLQIVAGLKLNFL